MTTMAEPREVSTDRTADPEKLRAYTRKKLAIAAQLRALLDLLKKRASEARFHRCEELMVKLAEDRFTLAVVGQFKRGKSSLMNAIIGRELLPTGVLPLTSAITVLKFGPAERLVVRRENSPFPEIVPVSALADYVTERGNPSNRKKVKTATVEVPLPFLRRGLEFVDTPGVGSAIEANTATTHSFLPECDAVLFVTSVDAPFTAMELDFLRAIRGHVSKIFFVVNKTDLLHDEHERQDVLRFVESELRAEMETARVRIFPVSSRLSLTENGGHESGLKELQETLATFLSEEKSAVFLVAVIDKALRLAGEEAGDLELHERARALPEKIVRERMEALRAQWETLARARQQLTAQFRRDCLQRALAEAAGELDLLARVANETIGREVDRIVDHAGWRLGEEAAERWSALLSDRVRQRLSAWLHEMTPRLETVMKPGADILSSFEANLREISALTAAAFDVESRPIGDPLLHFETRIAFDQRIETPPSIRPLRWFSFLPCRLIRGSLKEALKQESADFIKCRQDEALSVVADAVKRAADGIEKRVEGTAAELQSRLAAAITGERPANAHWRQSSTSVAEAGWGDAALAAIQDNLLGLRGGTPHVAGAEPAPPDTTQSLIEDPTAPSPNEPGAVTETSTSDLAKDLKTRGCAVCDHLVKTAFEFFAHWQYAISAEEKAQAQFASEQGFCPLHMWQLHAVSSTLGESIGLARLIEQMSASLKQTEGASHTLPSIRSNENCRVCQLVRQSEVDYINRLAAFLGEALGRETYARSQGVCLRHLALLPPRVSDEVAQFLLDEASRHFGEAAEDMQSYAIKRDALRRTLNNLDEEDAHLRALIHLAGAKDVVTPWPEDREI